MNLFQVQGYVALALGLAALGLQAFAILHALSTREDAFRAAGKRTKGFWLIVTGVAVAIGFISVRSPLNIFNLIAVVGAAVYIVDVKPAVQAVQGRGGGRSNQGPYGPY